MSGHSRSSPSFGIPEVDRRIRWEKGRQWREARQFMIADVARIFAVPERLLRPVTFGLDLGTDLGSGPFPGDEG